MTLIKLAVILLLTSLAGSSVAQNVINADSAAVQTTIRRDDVGFVSCGFRVIAQIIHAKESEVYDFSVNLDAKSVMGFLKAGRYNVPGDSSHGWDINKRKTVMPAPENFWIAPQAGDIVAKPVQLLKSDDAGFVLEIAEFGPTTEVISAMIDGKPIQFALRYPKEKMDRIVSFKTQIKEEDKATFFDCFNGIERRLKKEIENRN
jgi:hypothetical protein